MGDPDEKFRRQTRRKNWVRKKRERNFIVKKLWEDRRYRPKTHEVRAYEDEDWKQEVQDYLDDTYDIQGND